MSRGPWTNTKLQQMRLDAIPPRCLLPILTGATPRDQLLIDAGTHWVSVRVTAVIPKTKKCVRCRREFVLINQRQEYCGEKCSAQAKYLRWLKRKKVQLELTTNPL
jgi:hypothetical protein